MAIAVAGPTSSPMNDAARTQVLDSAPPMPPDQRRSPSPLFTQGGAEGGGMNSMGGDPMVQTMQVMKQFDQGIERLASIYPQAVDPLAQLQQAARQLVTGLVSAQASPAAVAGAPGIMPPLPMQSGPTAGTQMGAGI